MGRLQDAYGSDASGTDGGCFAEFVEFEAFKTAYREFLPDGVARLFYSRVWFNNYQANANCIHAIAAGWGESTISNEVGVSLASEAFTFIYRLNLDRLMPLVLEADVAAHEFGHHFGLNDGCTEPAHTGEDLCLMSYDRDRADATTEFCGPITGLPESGHVHEVRGQEDPI